MQNLTKPNWQVILKVAAFKNKRSKKCGFAFEALNQEGVNLFSGGSSCGKKNHYLAIQDAVSEAVFKAKELGFNRILILSNSKGLDQGLIVSHLFVPTVVISHVLDWAYITTSFPVHHCRLNPGYV
uniref:RNase H type-1 domain-containing protein n=1 Tax=Quercus lobata TaxID=97700 RepID=A0A7N2MCL4_QUELO